MHKPFHPQELIFTEDAEPFVFSFHRLPDQSSHWDLMLKKGSVLWTWRCSPLPFSYLAQHGTSAVRIQDHRTAYLDYEGLVQAGRLGRISIICPGFWSLLQQEHPDSLRICLFPLQTAACFSALARAWSLPVNPGKEGRWQPIR